MTSPSDLDLGLRNHLPWDLLFRLRLRLVERQDFGLNSQCAQILSSIRRQIPKNMSGKKEFSSPPGDYFIVLDPQPPSFLFGAFFSIRTGG
jgi:hypothetical protein